MNKKVLTVLFILIILVTAFTGCFGDDKPKLPKGPNYEETPGEYPGESGWIDSDMGDTPQHVDSSIPLEINSTTLITILTIQVRFEDSDASHSESDEGSDPDQITMTLSNGINESDSVSGTTPCNLEIRMAPNSTEEGAFLSGNWEIKVQAVCGAGKPYTLIPRPGMIAPFVYKDQGVAYDLRASYTFLKETES